MRKLIAVIAILILLIPGIVLAESVDPIVGCWYMLFDRAVTPEMSANFGGNDRIIGVYTFEEDGTISMSETTVAGGIGNSSYSAVGKWSAENGEYRYSIVGLGEGDAYIEGDGLYLSLEQALKTKVHLRIRRMVPYDPYSDYIYDFGGKP